MQPCIVIVGGGIAGLVAAYRLDQAAPHIALMLVDCGSRLGGKIVTDEVDGFVVEGGPDSFLAHKPRGIGLCHELGLADRLHGTNQHARRSYVMRNGSLFELPEGLTGLIPSRLKPMLKTGLISPLGKLRMGLDFVLPPRFQDGDESLAGFMRRRIGREVYERLIEPLLGGIYAGDGEQLSLAATFPQLRQAELEHGGLIKGLRKQRMKSEASSSVLPTGYSATSAFVTLRAGLGEIVEALESALSRVQTLLGTPVVRVSRHRDLEPASGVDDSAGQAAQADATASKVGAAHPLIPYSNSNSTGYTLTLESGLRLQAQAILLATPAFATANLVAELDPEMAQVLGGIPYVSTATISVAYRLADIPQKLDGYGYIVPRAEGRTVLACTWTSSKFPHRAPEGFALLRTFIGRSGQEGVLNRTDEELLKLVRAELRDVLGITAPPIFSRIFRWPKGIPQYTLGHLDRLAAIERRLSKHPGIFLAGSAYRGVGIPDCIQSGELAAEEILGFFGDHSQEGNFPP